MKFASFSHTLALCGLLGMMVGQAAQNPTANDQDPQSKPRIGSTEAEDLLKKTLVAYASAKSYQGDWTYKQERETAKQQMTMEIKSKGQTRLYFHVAPPADQKPLPGTEPLPELLVVLDGKTAWFENVTEKLYYKVPLPKNAQTSPLMFIPQVTTFGGVEKKEVLLSGGKAYVVLQAKTSNGGETRMEIEKDVYHIRRIIADEYIGIAKTTSTLAIEKEVFDGDVSDSAFSFKPVKDAKEVPAPSDAAALFGTPDKPEKPGK
jgi:outer membrane lipoprotein-sorting protein